MPQWGEIAVDIEDPVALINAEPLFADRSYPSINRVTMDGIAVAWSAYSKGVRRFPIVGVCSAGSKEQTLKDETHCFEVMTGAPLPEGAGLVIQYEHLLIQDGEAVVSIDQDRVEFENVHRQGSDYSTGDCLLESGSMMHAPQWGIAASLGYAKLKCLKNPKVKIISTGDELVDVSKTPLAHQIRRSNSHALKASLLQNGYQHVDLDHVLDDEPTMAKHYDQNKAAYDLLIYSGGVSKGKFDYLPEVWRKAGVQKYFHEVSQRPGKPLWFGVDEKSKTAVLGLPGNPISSLVCLHRYLISTRPLYARLQGDIHFSKNLTFFVPVKMSVSEEAILNATPVVPKNSGEFASLAQTDGFIELPKDKSHFRSGESFRFYPWKVLL